jgi:hypothetical protein
VKEPGFGERISDWNYILESPITRKFPSGGGVCSFSSPITSKQRFTVAIPSFFTWGTRRLANGLLSKWIPRFASSALILLLNFVQKPKLAIFRHTASSFK